MSRSKIIAQVLGSEIRCTLTTPEGKSLILSALATEPVPTIEGHQALAGNQALVNNAWAFATLTNLKVSLPTVDEQRVAAKEAAKHRELAVWISEFLDDVTTESRHGWCSSCITKSDHRKVKRPFGVLPVWICDSCGSPTGPCFLPTCPHMATRTKGIAKARGYCAEHRHDIPSFERSGQRIDTLTEYRDLLKYDKPNLAKAGILVGVGVAGAAAIGPLALIAAPAIGGAIGAIIGGYSGAVATSWGLAMLGGGAIAAGGLGMAGGTMVLTAVGATVGGGISASIVSAYTNQDKSFHIEMLKGGAGTPVVVCNGFLTEEGHGWDEWKHIITGRYPDSPVYRVHWGAKELKDLGFVTSKGLLNAGVAAVAQNLAAKAAKAGAKKLGPLGPLMIFGDLAKNPWHVAKTRADKTGVILADLLARTLEESYILVGHSLGARAMTVAAETLGTTSKSPRIRGIHLLGNAIGAKSDWRLLAKASEELIYNYHSRNDVILKIVYPVAQAGQSAAGYGGFAQDPGQLENIVNIDVTEIVSGHSNYHQNVDLR